MGLFLKKQIARHFQNNEIASRIIADLLTLDRQYPGSFDDIVVWIQTLFEKSHLSIGSATVMADKAHMMSKNNKGIVKLDDFFPLRFRNPETGYQLIITLMELEARINGILFQIMRRTEATLEDAISRKGVQNAPSPAKLLLFKGKKSP